ncbi:extracellular solute-binding protein [Paenibacillus eucommiae]|uniref:Multiple sugar transport system substrate-binding protein n=1 Tax=Paenibacillus eucommiae TaxID=1355755 RepID=A0ABS4J1S8_9BACL|nr:extracellular solute-binding protein [Paenibacillus eucommiae]MBP1993782.1 multiple sugar transport system substrate-binding protein [Paenibacillus eucommiae]
MQRETEFLYRELADILRNQIHSGLIKPGSLLMSESEMCTKYRISRTSVRKALDVLLEEELIVKIHGKGTLVSPNFRLNGDDNHTLVIVTTYPSNYAKKGLPILIRKFQERYPDYKVKVLPIPYEEDAYFRDMHQFEASPDLFLIRDSDFQQIPHQTCSPLDELINDGVLDIPPTLVEAFKRNGRLYALPCTYSPIYLAYNPELFAANGVKPPDSSGTIEQFIDTAKKLTMETHEGASKRVYGFAVNARIDRWLQFLLNKSSLSQSKPQVVPLFLDNGQFDWQSFREVLQFLQDALYRHQFSPVYSVSNEELTHELFEKGHIAMLLTSTLAFDMNPLRFGMASLPFGAHQHHLFISNIALINKFSKRQEMAKLFLSLSLEPEVQREISLSTGLLAVSMEINKELLEEHQLQTYGLTEGELEHCKFLHQVFPNMDLLDALTDEMKYFWTGLESPDVLIERLQELDFLGNNTLDYDLKEQL